MLEMSVTPLGNDRGRSVLETIVELLVVVAVAPAIICCLAQAVTTVLAIAIPWIGISIVAVGVAICLSAALVAVSRNGSRRLSGGGDVDAVDGDTDPTLPIRRPPGLSTPSERREP